MKVGQAVLPAGGIRAGLFLVTCVCLCPSAARPDILIRNVTIIDVATGTAVPKRSILIHADQIASVNAAIPAPKQARIIDGSGKFVIPGLWDMHVHLTDRGQLPLYPAYGVTGVRDMGSDLARVREWRGRMLKDNLILPHIETCGPPVDGFPSGDPKLPVSVVRSPNEARSVYDQLDDQSVDFICVLPSLPRDAYFALIERARKYFSPVAGAVPATVRVLEAVEARQKSIEHMSGILLACSTEEKRFRGPRALALERRDWEAFEEVEAAAAETFSADKADALFDRMALFETRSVPTLTKLRVSPCAKGLYEKLAELLVRMQRHGVVIMAGADGGPPGESLHEELELLVAAGLTPAQALRGATLEPAKYLDAAESLGAVEQGKIADLVLLDANPLTDIRNTRKIVAVVLAGKYLSKTRLNLLRSPVKSRK